MISASECGALVEGVAAKQALQEIGARDDSDERLAPQHRQPLDVVADHPVHRLAEFRILSDRLDIAGHHFASLRAVLMGVSVREPAAANEKLEPVRSLLGLASELAAAKQVALAQDPAQRMVGVEHDQRAHPRTQHRLDRFGDARAFRHADHAIGHNVANLHVSVLAGVDPFVSEAAGAGKAWLRIDARTPIRVGSRIAAATIHNVVRAAPASRGLKFARSSTIW